MKKKSKVLTGDQVPREECLELRLAISEAARIEAQLAALQSQFQLLQPTLGPTKEKAEKLQQALKNTYHIGDNDTLNIDTGAISRGPAPEAPTEEATLDELE